MARGEIDLAFAQPITLESFCQLNHVIVSPDGGGFWGDTDDALKTIRITRHVALSVPHFLFMHAVLRNSDLVGMVPERLVQHQVGLTTIDVPITLPTFDITMLWHERSHRDPSHQWLREQIVNAMR
ncbi:LysR substrate-binding domain-containing protein [Vibrio sp. PP-XX7]